MEAANNNLLTVENLKKHFPIKKGLLRRVLGHVKAVDDVSFKIRRGETLGLVGESGCGKSTIGKLILRALKPTAGTIMFRVDDEEVLIHELSDAELRSFRRHAQLIFQDPYASLNPRMTVREIIGEPILVNRDQQTVDLDQRVKELMDLVGLDSRYLKRYPHAFSGGQRQRIGVARALALNPDLIVADEPVSALDVSIQAQILNLLHDIQQDLNLTYLFISHDLSVVEHISDRVAVMYVGKLVELADNDDIFRRPKHPYTEALLAAVPQISERQKRETYTLGGNIADPANPPSGCYFHPRCRYAKEICKTQPVVMEEVSPRHQVACHLARELSLKGL
ncbi:MAG: dipeptide ABC transporter ATP-binding protein [Fidelibacterota bacterium]|nr:MAG: dipeptide ABC transporter ATP-binding protein [Candidatus Neomarinimicrobiota bacterium]